MKTLTPTLTLAVLIAACGSAQPATSTSEGEVASEDAPAGCSAGRQCSRDPDSPLACQPPDATRPCGPMNCDQMHRACRTGEDCLEGYRCEPCESCMVELMCQIARCEAEADCGSPNLECTQGLCAHRACEADRECEGYCVVGRCWDRRGWCQDRSLPPPP